jgi:hypothetical protein
MSRSLRSIWLCGSTKNFSQNMPNWTIGEDILFLEVNYIMMHYRSRYKLSMSRMWSDTLRRQCSNLVSLALTACAHMSCQYFGYVIIIMCYIKSLKCGYSIICLTVYPSWDRVRKIIIPVVSANAIVTILGNGWLWFCVICIIYTLVH